MRPRRSLCLLFSLIVLVGLVPAAVSAAQVSRAPSDTELVARYTPGQIQEYRDTIREIFNFGHEVAQVTKNSEGQKLIDSRMQLLDKATDADLARLMSYGADFKRLRDSMVSLRETLNWPSERNGLRVVVLTSGFPNADYDFCGSTHGSAAALLAAQVTLDIAKGVWAAASRACDQVAVVLGEGGNTSLVCIIADGILTVAEAAFNGVQFCENDIDSAEINGSYRRLAHIHSDLEASVANDNANKTTIVNNDNANRDTIVNNDNSNRNLIITNSNANRDAILNAGLRIAIEANLSENEDPVAMYQLPAPQGYLDLARSIVRLNIDGMRARGQNVYGAERYYSNALTLISQGKYKWAYRKLQQSYREATKVAEPDDAPVIP
jgi:hypothetical protein